MSVLNRRLFNRGGRVNSSRGVGITSGLVPSYAHGGLHEEAGGDVIKDRFKSNMEMFRELDLIPERKPFNKFQNIAPAALDFFGGLMSGKSMQGGLGGGLEIAGESLKSASPLFAEALKNKQEYDATDPEAALKNLALTKAFETPERIDPIVMKPGETLTQFNPDTGEYEPVFKTESIQKDKKLYTVNPNVKLIDPIDGTLVAQGVDNTISKLYKLNPGEALYDNKGEQITYLPDPNDEVIKLKPGEIAYSSDGETILAENKTDTNKIIKLKPGETAFSSTGEVIAQLNAKEKSDLKYATLSPGEEYYDSEGKLIARGSTVEETLNAFHSTKTGDERLLKAISLYESRMKLLENGEFDLKSLNAVDRADYLRKLMLVDPGAKEDAKNWSEFVATIREDVGFIEDYSAQLELAQATFDANSGTGPVRGAIKPVFDVFMDISGVNIPAIANKLFRDKNNKGRDILLDPVEGTEMVRLQNAVAIAMQETIKGNASNFEQQMLLKSLFSIYKNPEANALAFENMKYINDLKKQRVLFAETSNNYAEMDAKIKKWKTENKPSMLKNNDEILSDLGDIYGIDFSGYGALEFEKGVEY
jgi:hypothetical protein